MSQHLLHLGVDSLTHLRPAVSDQDRTVSIDVDQSSGLHHNTRVCYLMTDTSSRRCNVPLT